MSKKKQIIMPPVDDDFIPTFKDPPLMPGGDVKLDEKGHIIEEPIAKTFQDVLAEQKEAEDWPD